MSCISALHHPFTTFFRALLLPPPLFCLLNHGCPLGSVHQWHGHGPMRECTTVHLHSQLKFQVQYVPLVEGRGNVTRPATVDIPPACVSGSAALCLTEAWLPFPRLPRPAQSPKERQSTAKGEVLVVTAGSILFRDHTTPPPERGNDAKWEGGHGRHGTSSCGISRAKKSGAEAPLGLEYTVQNTALGTRDRAKRRVSPLSERSSTTTKPSP